MSGPLTGYALAHKADEVLNRVAKWRGVFAGWQLGTRAKGDPESDAVRDHRELSMFLRIELNALTALLIEKGLFTSEEFTAKMVAEAEAYDAALEKKFPGMKASDEGMVYGPEAVKTMAGWLP